MTRTEAPEFDGSAPTRRRRLMSLPEILIYAGAIAGPTLTATVIALAIRFIGGRRRRNAARTRQTFS